MIDQSHIERAINNAEKGISNLDASLLAIRGFSPAVTRHFINNLCNIEGIYLEVGLLCGATFCASFNKNCESIGLEDFSQNFQADIPNYDEVELNDNIRRFTGSAKGVYYFKESFLEIDKSKLGGNIDIYFYDGEHGIQNQSVALPEFFDNMAERFVFIVDDFSWPQVADGTGVGFKFLRKRMAIEREWELNWHTGLAIYLINKT